MKYIPQAIADEKTKQILFVFETESHFAPFKDKIQTVDAPGILTHPAEIKVGDIIGFFRTGWDKTAVNSVKFNPNILSRDYHIVGEFTFECVDGFRSVRVDGRNNIDFAIYKFL